MLNPQVVLSSGLTVGLLYGLRELEWEVWVGVVAVPAVLYALCAERTRSTALKDKHVLVTGASSGIGLAIAKEAARRGAAAVLLVARGRSDLENAAHACEAVATNPAFEAVFTPCDVTDFKACRALVRAHPRVDILVNNAGSGAWKHIDETSPDELKAAMDCPYLAAAALSSIVAPAMLRRPDEACHVLNVTSASCESAYRGAVGYGAARWAIKGFSRYLARDLAGTNVGVTLLVPAEVSGTNYFNDAPGKAGASSKSKIPALFQLVDRLGLNWSADRVARAALDGVERGAASVYAPWYLLIPTKLVGDVAPGVVEFLCALGPAGRREPPSKLA